MVMSFVMIFSGLKLFVATSSSLIEAGTALIIIVTARLSTRTHLVLRSSELGEASNIERCSGLSFT